jgi:hypothetical protein
MVDINSILDSLTPGSDKKNRSLQKKILGLFFPKFSWRTFTFWFGLIWFCCNMFIILSENMVKRLVRGSVVVTMPCRLLMFGASCTPLIKYEKHYHRLLLGPFICDNIMQALLGLYIYWSYGFLYEKHYSKVQILVVTFGATLLGSMVGCFWEFKDIRAQGTCHVIAWGMLYSFLLWEKLNYNILWFLVKLIMMIMKCMAVLMGSLSNYGDPIGTIASAGFSMMLGLSIIKEVGHRFDEEKKFILMRLKIFLFIISIIIFLFSFAYVSVMYDNRSNLELIKRDFACDTYEKV